MRRTAFLSSCVAIVILLMVGWAYAATFTVDSLGDWDDGLPYTPFDGTNTLRKCIRLANNNFGGDLIDFAVSGVIFPGSPLPEITDDGTIIDASSQWMGPWPAGQPGITLDGIGAGANEEGLKIFGASDCQIRGLFITNFGGKGVLIFGGAQSNTIGGAGVGERNVISGNGEHGVEIRESSAGNTVSGNYIGTDVSGTLVLGNAGHGISIWGEAQANVVGGLIPGDGNIISGNGSDGVHIDGPGTDGTLVVGNYIGTDATGTADLGNAGIGVAIHNGAQSNIIGGMSEGERNIISGNDGPGVQIARPGTNGNLVMGNYIGTDVTGTADLGNAGHGVGIHEGAQSNTIGGARPGEGNVISGNDDHSVVIVDSGTDSNRVSGNYIGTDFSGTADLGNSAIGVLIAGGAQSNIVGGATPGERNIISGNDGNGVGIGDPGTSNNVVSGNYIGTDVNGTAILGNAENGIAFWGGAQSNIIGGTTPGERNIISGNDNSGVGIWNAGTNGNIISGNYIGIDITGIVSLGNTDDGVTIGDQAQSNIIGGATEGSRNIISGNNRNGIGIWGSGVNGNMILGNYIGTDASGTADLGNSDDGVEIGAGAQSNTVGGTTPGERNIISGNDENGVGIWNAGTSNNIVSGNLIGTDVTGTFDLGNSGNGIAIADKAQLNTIGGTTPGERNVISGNDGSGVGMWHSGTNNNMVLGNYIGTDATGTVDLGNSQNGVAVGDGAQSNTIGGTTPGERNIISGNNTGVGIGGPGTTHNLVSGNYIGTDVTGAVALGNSGDGVNIWKGSFNVIGGKTSGERNIISGNDGQGVNIAHAEARENVVSGNYIGTDVTGIAPLGNTFNGIHIWEAKANIIGGATEGERNVISNNGEHGINIDGDSDGADDNRVMGNYIGTDVTGTVALGNTLNGVRIAVGAQSNIIGGTTAGERNIISGNGHKGVVIINVGTDGNKVSGNYIGTDVTGTADLGNAQDGIAMYNGAKSNTIGGITPGERNIISGNGRDGIDIGGHLSGTSGNTISGNYIGTDVTGTADLGNSYGGIDISVGSQSNTIGGTDAGAGNTIAFNDQAGVVIRDDGTDFNRISRNSMHDNADLGIDLVDGGNDEIPAPAITSGDLAGNTLTVSGTGAGAGATVEVFKADSFASGEGMTYLGSLTADGSGGFSGPLDVTGKGISAGGDPLVATTTHTNNNTSEFSAPIAVTVSYVLIPATIDLDPDTLNIKSKGKWISCYIELSEDYEEYSVEQIDTTSVKLWVEENHIPAEEKPVTVGDYDKDDIPDLMVKFDKSALTEYLSAVGDVSEAAASEYVTLTVNGQVGDDAIFEGTDTVKITGSGKATAAQEELAAPARTSEFALYQNFPNSFNPDTWIPYSLAEDAEVTITIYSVSGELIRILDLGHKPAGFYTTRSKAAYWDGRNEAGEQVSSGIYFCNIKAGEYTATRKTIARN